MKKELVIALDSKGHKVVLLNEIVFYGKRNPPWDKVEQYLKRYIGKVVTVAESGEEIHIGSDFPNEYKGSQDTLKTRGHYAKAKANAVQGIVEMVAIARKTNETENLKEKVHIAINLIDDLCHEIVYHKHNSMDYDVMIDVVVECIKNLLV